ncbi:MAG TPA: hypothetical protein P5077_13565, partial [bacterium]|nr:hypothetical protein [bacterium]
AYERLRSLLAQWRTETTLTTDDAGQATVAAFAGGYRITATYEGKSAQIDTTLEARDTRAVHLTIAGVEAPDDARPDDDALAADTGSTKNDGCGCVLVM